MAGAPHPPRHSAGAHPHAGGAGARQPPDRGKFGRPGPGGGLPGRGAGGTALYRPGDRLHRLPRPHGRDPVCGRGPVPHLPQSGGERRSLGRLHLL
ncbi:hypothetical protein B5E80_14440 [Flavonifractor sp. An135]|nr:hypothetical protein B5E80_14440 [Flavonifractor sp. An135]